MDFKIKINPKTDQFYFKLIVITIFLSFIAKLYYLFHFTDYKNYLHSDCGAYWGHAEELFSGKIINEYQWCIWPPLYHIILSYIFKIIYFFGALAIKLEIILVLQILLCSFSVYYLYLIALDSTRNYPVAFLATSSYAFSYMMIYFKAFILSENLAIPLLIFSIWCLFKNQKSYLIVSGILLALVVGIRPMYLPLALPFSLYIFLSQDPILDKVKKALSFILSFSVIIFLIIVHNNYISQGKLKALDAHGGISFYQSFTKLHSVSSQGLVLIPVAISDQPNLGSKNFQEPIYDSPFFIKLGIEYIKNNPKVLLEKFSDYKYLIFGPFLPQVKEPSWSSHLIWFSRWQMLFMFLCSLLIGIVLKSQNADNAKMFLLLSIPLSILFMIYFIIPEYRFFYSFAFVIHITFFATMAELIKIIRNRNNQIQKTF